MNTGEIESRNLARGDNGLGREWWSLIAVLLIAAVWMYRSPYNASNLEVSPDSVEYAIGALQFLETGKYEIIVQGQPLPPRYPPWFSLFALLPGYILFGNDPGNAIVPVTVFAVAGIGFAWAIGRQISSTAGAVLASLAVLAVPTYAVWGAQVMTDVPCTALMLGACLLYLRLRARPSSPLLFAAAGTIVALATLFRPVFAAMTLPFAFAALANRKQFIQSALALLLPLGIAAAASFAYNARTFGSATRNGYHFWTAVPSDYPALAFSFANVPMNLSVIGKAGFPLLIGVAFVAWLVARRRNPARFAAARDSLREVVAFGAMTAVPISLFHLVYFFPGSRFHLPALAAAAVVAGSAVGLLIDRRRAELFKLLLPALFLLALGWRLSVADHPPHRRIVADLARKHTPDNAVIISGVEPGYLDRVAATGSARRIVPLSRQVEYASKLLVPKRIDRPEPPPLGWRDHRAAGLINAGAREAVPFVASERVSDLVEEAKRGTPVFIETSMIGGPHDAEIVGRLQQHFTFVQRTPYLYELQPR